jgi:hypothetical protein
MAVRRFAISGMVLTLWALGLSAAATSAQSDPAAQPVHIETGQELLARMTPAQKEQFDTAGKAFDAHQYADALAGFKALLKELPGDPVIAKFSSEAALQSGDSAFALEQLKPIVRANPDDWQAVPLLARAYAESGDAADRDAGMAQMVELHKRGVAPPNIQQYTIERIKAGDKFLVIRTSIVPWGVYKVYDLGQLMDSQGNIVLRVTIESGDFDQPLFAQQHPKEAAAGVREFSLDAYRDTGMGSNGEATQTHTTYKFFVGQPSYDTVRQAFLDVATGKAPAMSSRSGLPTP